MVARRLPGATLYALNKVRKSRFERRADPPIFRPNPPVRTPGCDDATGSESDNE
jgi:hypothetical protein